MIFTSITSPTQGSTVKGTVAITAEVDGDVAPPVRVEFYFDSILIGSDDTYPYSVQWNTLDPAQPAYDGTHALTVRAWDSRTNNRSGMTKVTVANTAGSAYQATFSSTTVPQTVLYDPSAGTQQGSSVDLTVTNTSGRTWPGSSTKVGYRWLTPGTGDVADAGGSVPLGGDLAAGASRQLRLDVAPPVLGDGVDRAQYDLRFDVYDTGSSSEPAPAPAPAKASMQAMKSAPAGPATCWGCGFPIDPTPTPTATPTPTPTPTATPTPPPSGSATWFAAKGNKPQENPVIVNKALETGLGLERYYHYDRADAGGGMQHLLNVANGNSLLRWTPFSDPGRGLSTVVDLTYNSLEKKCECPAGNNFSLGISSLTRLGLPLDIHPNKADEIGGHANKWIEFTDGDGTTHRFTGKQAADGSTYWEEPAGVHLFLRHYSDTDANRAWAVTRPDRVTFFYDQDGFPTSVEDKNGNRLTFTSEAVQSPDDPGGVGRHVIKVTDAGGRSISIDYFTKDEVKKPQIRGRVQSITDHAGHRLVFDYYADGNLLQITRRGGTNPDGSTLPDRSYVFTYTTSNGAGPAIPDPAARANPDAQTPNESTLLYSVRDPRGKETTFDYCSSTSCASAQNRWKLQKRTDRAGNATTYAYDIDARRTIVTAPLSRVSKFDYDAEGKVTRITDPKNLETALTWGPDRNVTKVVEPGGGTTDYAYNENGYPTDVTVLLKADDPSTTADESDVSHTKLDYDNVPADGRDVAGKWAAGRTTPHISQLVQKTEPNGMATPNVPADHQWHFAYDEKGNLQRVTDPESNVSKFDYNADGTLSASTDPRGVATAGTDDDYETQLLDYDANGFPTRVIDAEDHVTHFGYDDDGQLRWMQDPVHSDYSATANPGLDPRAYRTYFDYDPFDRAVRQSTPKSTQHDQGKLIWSSVAYDSDDNPVRIVAPHYDAAAGAVTTLDYDAMDRNTRVTAPPRQAGDAGAQTVLGYDAAGRLTSVTRPKGVVTATDKDYSTTYGYDPLDRVVTETAYPADGDDAGARTTHSCYDTAGNLESLTPPRGNDAFGGCPAGTDFTRSFTHDLGHRLTKETDPRVDGTRSTRSYRYDADGNVVESTNERGDTQKRTYDQRDLLEQVTDPFVTGRDVTTRFRYDAAGQLKRLISPRAYDASADKSTFDDYATGYDYDQTDHLVKISLPTGPIPTGGTLPATFIHRSYDGDGNLLSTSVPTTKADPANLADDEKTTLTYWDPAWIRTSKEPNDPAVTFDYRAEGWQTSRTPDGSTGQTWSYFDDGLLRQVSDKQSKSATYGYDLDGNLTSAVDARGQSDATKKEYVEATYDGFDEPTKSRHRRKDDGSDPNWHFSTYAYDADGNVVRRVDDGEENDAGTVVDSKQGRTTTLDYDARDWLTRQIDDSGSPSDCSDDRRVESSYFETGWDKQQIISRGGAKDCDATTKQPTSWNVKQKTTRDYFRNGRLKNLQTVNGSGDTLESHDIDYVDDGVYLDGNRVKDTFTQKGPAKQDGTPDACASGCTTSFQYDPRDKVVKETLTTSGGRAIRSTTYTLDPAGNVTKQDVSRGGASSSSTYRYVGNQLVQSTIGGATAKYLYDPDGNLDCVAEGEWTSPDTPCPAAGSGLAADYSYDYLDRLTGFSRYTTAGGVHDDAHYAYDALNRPVRQTERHASQGSASIGPEKSATFDYQGLTDLLTRERHFSASGSLEKTNTYSYDAAGHRVAMSRTPDPDGNPATDDGAAKRTEYTYAYDAHGSSSLLVNEATGKADASYGYDAYGSAEQELTTERDPEDPSKEVAGGDQLNPYRYDGKRFDTGSATYDMGARRFGPDTGRFLQQDRYLGALLDLSLSTDPLTQNRYALAGGNPVSFVESDGHMPIFENGTAARHFSQDRAQAMADSSSGSSGGSSGGASGGSIDAVRSDSAQRAQGAVPTAIPIAMGGLPGDLDPHPGETILKECLGSSRLDCSMSGAAAGTAQLREEIIKHNAALRRSGDPAREARATFGRAPSSARLLGRLSSAAKVGGVASAGISLAQGEGVGRVAVKGAFSAGFAAGGAAIGSGCGPAAPACSTVLAAGGSAVGNIVGEGVADIADPASDALGDAVSGVPVVGGLADDALHGLFNK